MFFILLYFSFYFYISYFILTNLLLFYITYNFIRLARNIGKKHLFTKINNFSTSILKYRILEIKSHFRKEIDFYLYSLVSEN